MDAGKLEWKGHEGVNIPSASTQNFALSIPIQPV